MAIKILQIDLQNDITPQIGSYDNAGGVTPNNWRDEDGVYSLGPTNRDGTTPYYWFTPTREVADFDLCWEDYQDHLQTTPQYHLEIGDSTGNVVLSVLRQYANYYIGPISIGELAYQTWHKILIEVRKASAGSSIVTVYVDGKKVATGTSNTLLTSAKIALLGHVPNIFYMQNAGQRLRYVTIYDRSYTSKGINLDGMMTTITALISKLIAKLSTVALTGSYNDLSDKPTISTVNNGTLTIQRNGTTIDTFTANASVDKTINIDTADDTKIPLAGSNQISGSLIPSTDNSIDIGSSTKNIKMLYTKGITINGTQFLPSNYVPRSGGAVFTGQAFSRNVNDSTLVFRGGTNVWGNGAQLQLCGKDFSDAGAWSLASNNGSDYSTFSMSPNGTIYVNHGAGQNVTYATKYNWVEVAFFGGDSRDNGSSLQLHGKDFKLDDYLYAGAFTLQARRTSDYRLIGFADGTLTWNGQPIQTSSDKRLKQQISNIDDKLLDAWEDVDLVQFKYNDAVEQKGKDKARLHTGYVVQQIDKACQNRGVDVSQYGLYCHEKYPEETEEVEVEQADGTKVKETKVIREASEHYSLRYTEIYAVECMYLRRCIERLTARIEELEKEREAGK